MDDRRFDDLARSLVDPSSRRGALRLLAGALAALPLLRPDGAVACAPPGGSCNPNKPGKCCSGKCSPKGTCLCTKASQCPAPPACKKPVCTASGRCKTIDKKAGAACDDGDRCTTGDTCDANGVCQPDNRKVCDDGNACTVDSCDPLTGDCVHTPDDSRCPENATCDPQQGCRCPGDHPPCDGACADIGASCDTGKPGICSAGIRRCVNNQVVCEQTRQPRTETCNGLDDDCDGVTDEGDGLCTPEKVCQGGACVCAGGGRCNRTDCLCSQRGFYCHTRANESHGNCNCDPDVFCGDDCPCPASSGAICSAATQGTCRCDGTRCGTNGTGCQCGEYPYEYTVCKDGRCVCPDHLPACGANGLTCCRGGRVCQNDACVCDNVTCGSECGCPAGKTCRNGTCQCDGTRCDNGCGCSGGKVCQDGACVCDGSSCGTACGCDNPGDVCTGGFCRPR